MTRTRQAPTKKTPAKRAPRKTAAKTPAPAKPGPTLVYLRHPLPVRRRCFVGPHTPTELASIRAALAAASARIPVPVRTWNGSTATLTDGTLLIHNPGPDRAFTAHIACRHGAIHGWPITTHTDLREARALTHACERPHTTDHDGAGLDWDNAINHGVTPTHTPKTGVIVAFREGKRRAAHTLHDDTEPLNSTDITAGLAKRAAAAADEDQAKEHPQP